MCMCVFLCGSALPRAMCVFVFVCELHSILTHMCNTRKKNYKRTICWGYGDVSHVRVYFLRTCVLSGYTFFANFSCLCSLKYAFQPHSTLCVPSGYTISRFLIVFFVLSGSGQGHGQVVRAAQPRQSWYRGGGGAYSSLQPPVVGLLRSIVPYS